MFKYLMIGATALMLSACAGAILPPPPDTLPVAPGDVNEIDNTELCNNLAENEKNLRAWVRWGSAWATLFGVDLEDKIAGFTNQIEILEDAAEARNVACKVD